MSTRLSLLGVRMPLHARGRGPLLLTVAVLVSLLAPAAPARATPEGLAFGARVEQRQGETAESAVRRVETEAGRPLDVVREFLSWDSVFPEPFHTWAADTGRTLLLSVKSRRRDGTVVRWADVAAAQPGSRLHAEVTAWADRMVAYGKPIYFTYNHEPESKASAAMGEAPDFIAAWRRVHDIFLERGATNVSFMWIMTDYAFFVGSQARNDAAKWYPGDAYLEAMGTDAYNWFTCRTGINTAWWTLERIIKPFRDFGAAHPEEELWLTEWASTEDPARPGRKADWIREARALFKRPDYAQFHGVSYFDFRGPDSCQWAIDSSASSQGAFEEMGTDAFYGGPLTAAPPPAPVDAEISLVGTAMTNSNANAHRVPVPSGVVEGDTLVLFFTGNANPTTTTGPAGWTPLSGVDLSGLRGRVWTRTATAADVGTTVTVTSSAYTKADVKLLAYRGAGGAGGPIDVHAVATESTTRATHTAPSVTPTGADARVVVYWADKSSTNTDHVLPAGLTELAPTTFGSGSGYVTASVGDRALGPAGVATGTFTATGAAASTRAVMWTLVLRD